MLLVDRSPLNAQSQRPTRERDGATSLLASNVTLVVAASQRYRETHWSLRFGSTRHLEIPFHVVGSARGRDPRHGTLGGELHRDT